MIYRADAQLGADMFDEIVVDLFAGGGGASVGIEAALGRCVDVAVNHDPLAIAMHRANHPHTLHLTADVFEVDPVEATGGRPVGLLWASPDCTFFSKARGSKPIRHASRKRRSLAWVVVKWARAVRPRVIMLENVEEFADWGPLDREGRPCARRRGNTFKRWVSMLRAEGYSVQWRVLRACDYGAPTIRKRLFLVARCDGEPINWPEVTHADPRTVSQGYGGANVRAGDRHQEHVARNHPNNGAARAGADIKGGGPDRAVSSRGGGRPHPAGRFHPFRTAAECIDWSLPCPSIFERKKPLADATLRRIARGIVRYVIQAAEPFIVTNTTGHAPHSTREPLSTVTTGDHHYLVEPFVVGAGGPAYSGKPQSVREPLRTVMVENHRAVVAPILASCAHGVKSAGETRCNRLSEPTRTQTTSNRYALVSAFITKHYGGVVGTRIDAPLPTTTARGTQNQLTAAHLVKLRGTCRDGQDLRQPAPTITAHGNHAALVAALLVKFYGNEREGLNLACPLHTITTRDRFGLVTCTVQGETYIIVDIGMRMLQPHELYAAQGFPRGYVHGWGVDEAGGRIPLTKTAQVRLCGNSVCPPVPEALVRANLYPSAASAPSRERSEVPA